MIPGVSGRLISASFALTELPAIAGAGMPPGSSVRDIEAWSSRREASFGPSSGIRASADGIVIPLLKILGFTVSRRVDRDDHARLDTSWRGIALVPVVIVGWDQSLDPLAALSLPPIPNNRGCECGLRRVHLLMVRPRLRRFDKRADDLGQLFRR